MALEDSQVIALIKAGEPEFITEAKKKQKILDVHINKRGVDRYIAQIQTYENKEQFELRKAFSMSNKYVFENLLRPVDKVFSAKGGTVIYNTGASQEAQKKLTDQLNDVNDGFSIRSWIQKIQANKFYSDPAGLVYFEVSIDGKDTFPTIKSIRNIRNYKTEGRSIKWVIFEPYKELDENGAEKEGEFYRVVDEDTDRIYFKNGDEVKEIEDKTVANPWGRVPAIVNSDIINDRMKYSDSPVDPVIELADKYFRTNSIKSVHEFLHGFPYFWEYVQPCASCKGAGEKSGGTCGVCDGIGYKIKRDVSDSRLLKTPKKAEDPTITPDVAGYVVPPLDIPKEQREELSFVWTLMHFTTWGTSYTPGDNDTATGAFLNVAPVNDRLCTFSESFEDMEQKMTDFIGEFYLPDAYKGSSILYGKRFLIERADAVLDRYLNSKEKDAPKTTLTNLLIQYYQSEYSNDPITEQVMIKGAKLEPFVHDDISEVKEYITEEESKQKVYFNEWWKLQNSQYILISPIEKLWADYLKWLKGKIKS